MSTGRFAPSPTGVLHLGNLRTALAAWLVARASGGRFIVRMEDLDRITASPEHEAAQLRDLAAIGLDWDGPVVRQSERFDLHLDAIATLVRKGCTYECFCTRREIQAAVSAPNGPTADGAYPGTCRLLPTARRLELLDAGRRPAIRLRACDLERGFVDRVCGPFGARVDDVVIRRNDRVPAYNLAVVVDDHLQGVEEVVRADDLLASTPRQILIGELLGLRPMSYAHLPLVLDVSGERLAKRHRGATLADQARLGADTIAVRSVLAASLGLCAADDRPTLDELVGAVARLGDDLGSLGGPPWRLPDTV
jgi:glutamyl-tRNA synthetase